MELIIIALLLLLLRPVQSNLVLPEYGDRERPDGEKIHSFVCLFFSQRTVAKRWEWNPV